MTVYNLPSIIKLSVFLPPTVFPCFHQLQPAIRLRLYNIILFYLVVIKLSYPSIKIRNINCGPGHLIHAWWMMRYFVSTDLTLKTLDTEH
jgi:hypothetical protein